MTTTAASTPICPFCDKQGLPILPVRYAVARTDLGNAPSLPPAFGAGVADIALPSETAKYTLRLLRTGYLYVYDEHRNEWSAYVVNNQSYLWEFDIHAKTPPAVENDKTFNAACRGKSDPYVARCLTVKSAARATKVWLGFSDVAWTPAVLAKHASAEYRRAHMQCIDLAAWRGSGMQPHVASFDALPRVAEFAADGLALHKETRQFLQRFLPAPYRLAEDIAATNKEAREAKERLSPMVRSLLESAVQAPAASGPMLTAAWAFSPHMLHLAQGETSAMTTWGNQAARPYRPVIVGMIDPVGIATDLNGLINQRTIEFIENKSRKWKYETALLIAALKQAIGRGAVQSEAESKRFSAELSDAWLAAKVGYPTERDFEAHRSRVERAGKLGDVEQEAVARDSWSAYAKCIEEHAWEDYVGTDTKEGIYQKEFNAFSEQTVKHLDLPYVAWLKSETLQRYFTHNFDPNDVRSGEAYLGVVGDLIAEASGRSTVFQHLTELVQQDPRQSNAWLSRALALNHTPLIQAWSTVALENASESAFSWAVMAEKFHERLKDIVGEALENHPDHPSASPYTAKFDRLVFQICGPLVLQLSKGIDRSVAASFPTCFQMGALCAVAKATNPDLVPVDLRGMWTRKEAARTLAGMLAKQSGGNANAYRSAVRAALDQLPDADGSPHPYHGVMLVDTAKARELAGMTKAQQNAAIRGLLTPRQFDEILQESVGRIANLHVKGAAIQLVLSCITLLSAYSEMMHAKPDDAFAKKVNFAGGLIGVIGGMSYGVGKGLENTAYGAAPLAKQYKFFAIEITKRAGWFTGVGTLLGAIGGVIYGVLAIKDGVELWNNHKWLAAFSYLAGFASITISLIAIFYRAASVLVLGLAGLIVAIVLVVVAWLKPNAIQDWLESTMDFGKGEKKFDSPATQLHALQALLQGE